MQSHYLSYVPRPSSPLTYPPISLECPAHVPVPFSLDILHDFEETHQSGHYAANEEQQEERQSSRPSSPDSSSRWWKHKFRKVVQPEEFSLVDYDGLEPEFDTIGRHMRRIADEFADAVEAEESMGVLEEGLEEPIGMGALGLDRPSSPLASLFEDEEEEEEEEERSMEARRPFMFFGAISWGLKNPSLQRNPGRRPGRRSSIVRGQSIWRRFLNRITRRRNSNIPPTLQDMVQKPVTPEEYHAYFLNLYMRGPSGSD